MSLPAWFDHLQENFSFKEVQLKKFYFVKTGCPLAENINGAPVGVAKV